MEHSAVLTELVGRTLDDIAREVADLRRENARLQGETDRLGALMPELETLRKENVDYKKAVSFFIRETQFVPRTEKVRPQLPPEVLSVVFDHLALATPPYTHKPDIVLGPRSPWMDHLRFQKRLALVCRSWWEPATRALYHRIVLRRMGQISALARALSAPANTAHDFSGSVKHIALHGLAIIKPYAKIVLGDLRFVLRRCAATLQSFSVVPHTNCTRAFGFLNAPGLDVRWMSLGSLRGVLCGGGAAGLCHLELPFEADSRSAVVELHHILSEATRLQSLKLEPLSTRIAPEDAESAERLSTLPTLTLPALRELQFSTRCAEFTTWATASCRFPGLTSLTLLEHEERIALAFLRAHGARLTYLHFRTGSYGHGWYPGHPDNSTCLEALGDVSPILEHLVVAVEGIWNVLEFTSSDFPLQLPHLRYVDIWLSQPTTEDRDKIVRAIERRVESGIADGSARERSHWRALCENVRLLATGGYSDLPRICHPAALSGDRDAVRTVCIRDERFVQTSWCVRAEEDCTKFSWAPFEDEAADPTYVEGDVDGDDQDSTSEDTSEGSDDASGGCDSDDGSDEWSAPEDGFDTWSEDQVVEPPLRGGRVPRRCLPEQWEEETLNGDIFPGRVHDGPSGVAGESVQ